MCVYVYLSVGMFDLTTETAGRLIAKILPEYSHDFWPCVHWSH